MSSMYLSRVSGAVIECIRLQVITTRRQPMLFLVGVVQPVALLLIVLPSSEGDSLRAGNLLISVLLTAFWGAVIWTAGGIIRREQATGTLAAVLLNRFDARLVILSRCFGATLLSLATLIGSCLLFVIVSPHPVRLPGIGWVLLGLLAVMASGTAVSLLLGCVFLYTRHAHAITNALMYPIFVVGGLLIPPAVLPGWLAPLRWLISLSWIRELVVNQSWVAGLAAAAVTAAYLLVGLWLFHRTLDKARREGTIDLV